MPSVPPPDRPSQLPESNVRELVVHQARQAPGPAGKPALPQLDAQTAAAILEGVGDGSALAVACRAYGIQPRQFYAWIRERTENGAAYTAALDQGRAARRDLAHEMVQQALDVAHDGARDVGEDGRVNYEVVARSKLRVDTLLHVAGKLDPGAWGQKPGDVDGGKIVVEVRDPTRGPQIVRGGGKGDPSSPAFPAPFPPNPTEGPA